MSTELDLVELRRLFDLYTDNSFDFCGILHALEFMQKDDRFGDWRSTVIDLMDAMELHDAGLFPAEWWPDEET
jgi:hypothetical protein